MTISLDSGAITAGGSATVAVPVATVWTSPDRVRPLDRVALTNPPDVAGWAAGMSVAECEDLGGRTLTQLLYGEPVLVEEFSGDFARLVALAQPSSGDPRGYAGWVIARHLSPAPGGAARPTHIVTSAVAALHTGPDAGSPVALADVTLGTALTVTGAERDGFRPVSAGGATGPGTGTAWVSAAATEPLPRAGTTANPDGGALVATASGLLGTRYVWGGLSPFGIDCSGLVHLAYRLAGLTVPRDAHDQEAAALRLEPGTEETGDVYFFARPGGRIHHVGFVAAPPDADGTMHMLHACGTRRRVVREVVAGARLETLTGAYRIRPRA